MRSIFRGLVRTSAFWTKELFEILRQPRLIFSLVLGPFLILLIFGIGYQNKAPSFRMLFVAQPNSLLSQHIQEYTSDLGSQFIYEGVTSDEAAALDRLERNEVDLVAVAPTDAPEKIQSNQQAVFTIYENQLDPFMANWAKYYAYVYVSEINKRILATVIGQGQSDAQQVRQQLQTAHSTVAAMRQAIQSGDQAAAKQHQQQLGGNIDQLGLALGLGVTVLSGVQQTMGTQGNQDVPAAIAALQDARQNSADLSGNGNPADTQTQLSKLNRIDADLTTLEGGLGKYQNIDPTIAVSPFTNQVKSVLPIEITPIAFFAPAVLALLLQHLGITLAALSIVREKSLGTTELFRVSPLTASEALIGKYLSYLLFTGVVAAILIALMIYVLRIPMLGNAVNMAIVIGAVLFASLSIGFVISLISQTDSQAVQYTMLVLLASMFFSGFIMSLDSLWLPVRTVSGLLPTTYGILMLRDIMLRGLAPSPVLIGTLVILGIVLYFVAWLLLRRLISRAQH